MKTLHIVAFLLVIVGGLNWLAVGLFGWDIGAFLGGQGALIPRIIYIAVGVSAIYLIITHKSTCKGCMAMGDKPSMPMMKQGM